MSKVVFILEIFVNIVLRAVGDQNQVRSHSTTTWTRRGRGVSKKSTLVHPGVGGWGGGSLDVHVDKHLKKGTEELWQMTMKSLITSPSSALT